MRSIFSYDSKFMQALMVVGDLVILNVLYLVCCIPIVTIGAAQAGLYSGIKVLQDREDDSSCAKAFFAGFRNGFKTITIVWCIFLVVFLVLGYNAVSVYILRQADGNAPFILSVAGLCICALFQSLTSLFHARFSCTWWQLVRNSWFLIMAHPLRSLVTAISTWLPLIFGLLGNFYLFMKLTPITLCAYYSVAFLLNFTIMKKPFQVLIDDVNSRNDDSSTAEEIEEDEAQAPALIEE